MEPSPYTQDIQICRLVLFIEMAPFTNTYAQVALSKQQFELINQMMVSVTKTPTGIPIDPPGIDRVLLQDNIQSFYGG